jgi:cell division protein ZapA (FtsZ GTPase activity inhibitor)
MAEQTTINTMIATSKKQVNLVIAGRSYPVQIDPAEEESLLAIVAEVNRRVEGFQQRHPTQDKQDFLAMAVLTYASELHKIQHTDELIALQESMAAKIATVDHILEGLLS